MMGRKRNSGVAGGSSGGGRPWLEFSVSGGTCFGRKNENEESTAGFIFESKFYRLSPAECSSTFRLSPSSFFWYGILNGGLNGGSLVAKKRCKRRLNDGAKVGKGISSSSVRTVS